jgi:hypothetical protein
MQRAPSLFVLCGHPTCDKKRALEKAGWAKQRAMTDKLAILIEKARSVRMSSRESEEQRRSFAYGNTKIENDLITRAMVDEQAEALRRARE